MKLFVFCSIVLLAAASTAVFASEAADGIDWGTKTVITAASESQTFVPDPVITDPAQKAVLLAKGSLNTIGNAFVTPDGESIVYTDVSNGIWKVPVGGGTPELVFDAIYLYPYNDFYLAVRQGDIRPCGFSGDGGSLFFSYIKFDTALGSKITVKSGTTKSGGGFSMTWSQANRTVVQLDMKTKEMKELVSGSSLVAVSRSGNILCLYSNDGTTAKTSFLEVSSGKTWDSPVTFSSGCFNADGRSMIYSGAGVQLFRISIDGGEPEQLSTYSSGDIGMKRYPYDCSPDGAWVVYHDVNDSVKVANTITSPTGSGTSSYTKPANRLCLFNMATRKTVDVFDYDPSVSFSNARFSGNGVRLCYVAQDYDVWDMSQQFGIYTYAFDAAKYSNTELAVNEAVPAPFALTGNRPNPFNPSTAISFTLNKAGAVNLAVYDITGRKVRDLVNGRMTLGRHETVWNGFDDQGARAASGVYIARLSSGGTVTSHRMLLMK